MKKEIYSDWRVEVIPEEPWFFNRKPNAEQHQIMMNHLRDLARDARRHLDCHSVAVTFDTTFECEHCGRIWSEASDVFNGGCCDEDMKNEPGEAA